MGGLTRTGGEINECKWSEAVGSWLLYDVDIVFFSDMQPSTDTSDVPECSFMLDYNAKKIRKPGRGTGCAIHRHLLEICTRINIPGAPRQSSFWILRLPAASLLVAAWYGPVRSKSRPASECRTYWKLLAESLWKARRLYPECLIIAGGDANVVLDVLHLD